MSKGGWQKSLIFDWGILLDKNPSTANAVPLPCLKGGFRGELCSPAVPQKRKEKTYGFLQSPHRLRYGFGMALAVNELAMNAYSRMTEEQKQAIINKAHNVRSEKEMYALVMGLANDTI